MFFVVCCRYSILTAALFMRVGPLQSDQVGRTMAARRVRALCNGARQRVVPTSNVPLQRLLWLGRLHFTFSKKLAFLLVRNRALYSTVQFTIGSKKSLCMLCEATAINGRTPCLEQTLDRVSRSIDCKLGVNYFIVPVQHLREIRK